MYIYIYITWCVYACKYLNTHTYIYMYKYIYMAEFHYFTVLMMIELLILFLSSCRHHGPRRGEAKTGSNLRSFRGWSSNNRFQMVSRLQGSFYSNDLGISHLNKLKISPFRKTLKLYWTIQGYPRFSLGPRASIHIWRVINRAFQAS